MIKFGSKQHKITFRDQVEKGEQITEIYEVESWKKYNAMMDGGEDDNIKCKCCL